MAKINLQLDKGLTNAEALRDVLKQTEQSEIVSIDYNSRNGLAKVNTRTFPSFGRIDPESKEAKLLNNAMESISALQAVIDKDRKSIDSREANVLRKERKLTNDKKALLKETTQLNSAKKQFDIDRGKAIKKGLFVGLKSFFHTQT